MTGILRDPLLTTGRMIVRMNRNFFGLAATVMLLAIPVAIVFDDAILASVHQHFSIAASYYPADSVVGLLLFCSAVLGLWCLFFSYLSKIVESVMLGDPFIAENIGRLDRMALLLVLIQLLYIPTAAFALIVETAFKGPTSEVQIFWDFTGMLMVLTLFVLARIFRHGANLRSDLEGTI